MWIQEKPEGVREKFDLPRKRRRKATATGGASDCFTCNELQRKCDRRRPYCTQCLEHGKDCSGYKTALTWNIEVASRGKLRGLALSIATSEEVLRRSIASGRKKIAISSQLQDQASEDFNFMHASSTCLAASEKHHRDLSNPLANVSSFNDEPFMRHGPMRWSQGSCFILSREQNSSDYLDLKPLPTVPIGMDTADTIRFGQPAFDIYAFQQTMRRGLIQLQVSTFNT